MDRMPNRHIVQLTVSLTLLAVCVVILAMLASGTIRPFLVSQTSMMPTLHPNDYVIATRYSARGPGPQRGDIIILRDPESDKEYLVKRVIALPGEMFEIRLGGALYINGEFISEPYVNKEEPPSYIVPPVRIRPDHYVVLGDNRNHSEDSVYWREAVPRERIVGKVRFIYAPLNRMGRVR